jgi:CHAT domain-containing protein
LHQWIVEPIRPLLEAVPVDTLVFVPDGALRSIPMSALYNSHTRRFLIQDYAIAVSPGLTLIEPRPFDPQSSRVLACGITDSVEGFEPLPYVADELENLTERFEAQPVLDESFTLSGLEQRLADNDISILHIASHGNFGGESSNSFILTHQGKLYLNKLATLLKPRRYSENPIELLTLSACQTAAGNDRAALGLAGVAIQAGARSSLATLWFVNDQASSDLIKAFYTQLFSTPSPTKAHALRSAQLDTMRDPRYRHPCYWAPYVLIGNWK